MSEQTLDKVLLNQDTNDQFIRGLMSSVVIATQRSNEVASQPTAFYEYANDIEACKGHIYKILNDISRFVDSENHLPLSDDMVDSAVYEHIVDLVDKLLEDADLRLEDLEHKPANKYNNGDKVSKASAAASMSMVLDKDRLIQQHADIEKPQEAFLSDIDNSRDRAFKPRLSSKPHAIVPMVLTEKSVSLNMTASNSEYIAPSTYYQHPYEYELKNLQYLDWQLEEPTTRPLSDLQPLDGNIVVTDNIFDLERIVQDLSLCTEIAIDLEHHSFRSFQGFTCLMQISTRSNDYLIDTIKLRKSMHILNNVTANPNIVKVFHGCEGDIVWLQKDFGIYVTNCFDTYHAAKLLKYPALSLAHLLKIFCNVTANKRYQLSDWRQRPLPPDMIKYARGDTHYLLHIYDQLRKEVWNAQGREGLQFVLDSSKRLCLQRYEKEFFWPLGYRKLLDNPRGRGLVKSQDLSPIQEAVLSKLWNWRDLKARELDESVFFVMSNAELLRIGTTAPRSIAQLEHCSPLSALVEKFKEEIIQLICEEYETAPAVFHQEEKSNASKYTEKLSTPRKSIRINEDELESMGETKGNSYTEKLYGRALKTPSKDLFTADNPYGNVESEPTTPSPDMTLPFQPYNQASIMSFTPTVPGISSSPIASIPQRSISSPPILVEEVFRYAKWNSVMSSSNQEIPQTDRMGNNNKIDAQSALLLHVKSSLEQDSRSLFSAPSIVPSAGSNAMESTATSTAPIFNSTMDNAVIAPPMTEREKLFNMLSKGSVSLSDAKESALVNIDATTIANLPASFADIYNISNELRRKKFDKKRVRGDDEGTISSNPGSMRLSSNLTTNINESGLPRGQMSNILQDKSLMGSRLFDESIYLKIASDPNIQQTIHPDKDIDSTLDIVESIGWISGSSEREDIMKQHMLDMMTQQPNDSNDNDSHLRRSTDSKDSTGNRPRSMPSSPLKSGNNSSNNIPPPPYPQGSPNKSYDYSKYAGMGALPPQPSGSSSSAKGSGTNNNAARRGNSNSSVSGNSGRSSSRDGMNRTHSRGPSPGSSSVGFSNPYFQPTQGSGNANAPKRK